MLIKHIALDLSTRDPGVEEGIRRVLTSSCIELYRGSVERGDLVVYNCRDSIVSILKTSGFLLVDIIGEERVFEELLNVLPREYIMVRLLERGFPVNR